jgi:hypothetical protein
MASYQDGYDAYERGEDFDPSQSPEWKDGWRDAARDDGTLVR